MGRIRVFIVDDQALIRDGLKTILETEEDMEVAGAAKNGLEACSMAELLRPDIILMDIRMPGIDGVESIKNIRSRLPQVKIIMLTTFNDEEYIMDAIANGASGYLLKDIEVEKLIETIHDAIDGKMILPLEVAGKLAEGLSKRASGKKKGDELASLDLTDREREIASMMVQGFTNRQIASVLYISEGTVRNYISDIYGKTGISNRTQAVLYLKEHGIR